MMFDSKEKEMPDFIDAYPSVFTEEEIKQYEKEKVQRQETEYIKQWQEYSTAFNKQFKAKHNKDKKE